jgi:hypothetical protein
MLDHARTLISSLLVCGPVLCIGLLMLIDPAGLVISLRALARVLQTVEHRFRGFQWQEQLREPEATDVTPAVRFELRFTGLALTLLAVAYLANAVK